MKDKEMRREWSAIHRTGVWLYQKCFRRALLNTNLISAKIPAQWMGRNILWGENKWMAVNVIRELSHGVATDHKKSE
jgi:hypothetical protein